MDVSGSTHGDVINNIFKKRLDEDGKPFEQSIKNEVSACMCLRMRMHGMRILIRFACMLTITAAWWLHYHEDAAATVARGSGCGCVVWLMLRCGAGWHLLQHMRRCADAVPSKRLVI